MPVPKVIEIRAARKPVTTRGLSRPVLVRELPDLPVLPETLVKLELAARERPIELARISEFILSDPGAAIQVMRLAAPNGAGDPHPQRMEDCISSLGVQACLDAMSKHLVIRCHRNLTLVEAWEHAALIAGLCERLAEEQIWHATPQDARWVGLCHEIGRLPEVLGWDLAGEPLIDLNLAGLLMAQAWSLPSCVVEYFSDLLNSNSDSPWTRIVHEAHQIAFR